MSDLFRTKAEFAYVKSISKQWLEDVLGEPYLIDQGFDNHSHLFASKSKYLFTLCSKEVFCVDHHPNAILIYDLVYHLIFDHTDIIHLSLPKEPNAGSKAILKRPRRSQRREEDKRFKPPDLDNYQHTNFFMHVKEAPPDLDQDKHQDISFFMLVKEAPPDGPYKPKPSLNRIGGNRLILHNSVITNLSYIHADGSDLRTNPFQVGGDDMNLTSTKQMKHEPEIEPAPNWQLIRNITHKREAESHEAVRGALLMPRTNELKGIHCRSVQGHGLTRSNDVNLTSTKESKADPEHEPQVKSLEEEKQVATDVWNEPDCPMTRSRTNELKKIIGGMLQATAQLGDDISLGNSKEERPEPEHKPEEDNRQDEELGGIKDALLTPRTKKLKEHGKIAQRLIKAPGAKPSTLMLIQA